MMQTFGLIDRLRSWRRTGRRVIMLVLAGIAAGSLRCDLFYPDDPIEEPLEIRSGDPYEFSAILRPTQEYFAKTSYDAILHERLEYHANDNQLFNRRQIIDRLEGALRSYDNITVRWDTTAATSEPDVFNKRDTVTLYRTYTLVTRNEVVDPQDTSRTRLIERTHAGRCRFDMVFHQLKITWCILRWYDEQDGVGKTFFHPDFIE